MDSAAIPGYEIFDKIGEGGGGAVYRARQCTLDRDVALKILLRELAGSEDDVRQFVNEARSAGRLSHPNIVQVYEAGECEGTCFIAMALVEGLSVGKWVKDNGPMPEKIALSVAMGVAEGLRYAWRESRLIHLDIKPENLLLDKTNAVKITDLGLAKVVGATAHGGPDNEVACTPAYCSPEIALGEEKVDLRADIYSLGATLYYMVTGKVPFGGIEGSEALVEHVQGHLPNPRQLNPSVSTGMAVLIRKMMARSPVHRHASWAEVLQDLARVARGKGPQHPLLSTVDSTIKGGRGAGRVKFRLASADEGRSRIQIKPPPQSAAPLVRKRAKPPAPVAAVPVKRASVRKVAASRLSPINAPAASPPGLGPGAVGAIVAAAVFVAVSIAVGLRVAARDLARERVQFAAAEACRAAAAYARRNPQAYDQAIAQFRVAAEAAAGTPHAAVADDEIRRLSAARQAAIEDAGRQLDERVETLVSRGLQDEALRACESYSGPFAAELLERREGLAAQLRREAGLSR